MQDGVVFVDSNCRIQVWNQTLEMMTGLMARKVDQLELTPSLFGLADAFGTPIQMKNDPIHECMRSRKTRTGDYKLVGRSGREVKVEMTCAPVIDGNQQVCGAVIMVHDTSAQLDLQRQLKDLYEFSMLDPLTQVANRAEFERALDEFVQAKSTSGFECSLIICDIDFFKQINDNYNHHIGDKTLVSFASLLKQYVRSQDVVARYGGEEFVILCANCDRDSAMERAEEIRKALRSTPQPMLDGKYITASFGVSQLRDQDSATDFFVRADTALLHAKEAGRNRVMAEELAEAPLPATDDQDVAEEAGGLHWRKINGTALLSHQYRTRAPVPVLVEKLRGYIIETEAEIRRVESNYASLIVQVEDPENYARKGRFEIDIDFQEHEEDEQGNSFGRRKYTYLRVSIREGRKKWFSANATELAPGVLSELRRYFMIADDASQVVSMQPATVHKER